MSNPLAPHHAFSGPVTLVTGTLAAPVVKGIAQTLSPEIDAQVVVLNIQVAALMTIDWVSRKLRLPDGCRHGQVVLPGYCRGDPSDLAAILGVPVVCGPRDVADLAAWLRGEAPDSLEQAGHAIEIVAEINHVSSMTTRDIVAQAQTLREQGADMIDLGCDPAADRSPWSGVGDAVRALRHEGIQVSIDSFQEDEVLAACRAGAELVLSVNQSNVASAAAFGAEVVAIPDVPEDLDSLHRTIERLDRDRVPFRIDPVLVPIGFGFGASLRRYLDIRDRYPGSSMLMGIGNLTEMTAADSGGINALLIGICQEASIHSVLTTQVINWARSSVREIAAARRLMHWAAQRNTVPKHAGSGLVMLRDAEVRRYDGDHLATLAAGLTDRNFRIFAEAATRLIHVMSRDVYVQGDDPFALFSQLGDVEPNHAFYLGFEMAKALTALELGKTYMQDEPLDWGLAGGGRRQPGRPHYDAEQEGGA